MSNTALMAAAEQSTSSTDGDAESELVVDLIDAPNVESVERSSTGGEVGFREAGDRELRPYGSSTRFSFTRTSLDLSGFTETESVDVYARPGSILLVSTAGDESEATPTARLDVSLTCADIHEGIAEVLDDYDVSIIPESVGVEANGTLSFALDVPSRFEHITERDVRPFGDSTSITLPPEALAVASLADGDPVSVEATTDAVLISRVA